VGWTSNNHAGGYVRLALVPEGQHKVYTHFEQNVLKIACYGHDERKGGSSYGDCKHPCNGRPGCGYQADIYDGNRYDTTIKIPYNLAPGVYVLQYMSAMSNHKTFYYSCSRLQISGGKPSLPCKRTGLAPVAPGCMKGMAIPLSKYQSKTKMGNFCFSPTGPGDQDADMRRVPINPKCDPRITCQLSVDFKGCMKQDRMDKITNPHDPQQKCGSVKPPPLPTCSDGIKNQGELMVDCGGDFCDKCFDIPTEAPDTRIYSNLKFSERINMIKSTIDVRAEIKIAKHASDWRFTLFFDKPITKWRTFWNCKLLDVNEYKTVWTFGPMPWTRKIKPGQKISLGFNGVFDNDGERPHTVTKSFTGTEPKALGCGTDYNCIEEDKEEVALAKREKERTDIEGDETTIYKNIIFTEQIVMNNNIMNLRAIVTISKAAEDWRWTMVTDYPVDHFINFWNCKLISVNEEKTEWTFGPMPWTMTVKPGQKISLGFNGIFVNTGVKPHTVHTEFTGTELAEVACDNCLVRQKRDKTFEEIDGDDTTVYSHITWSEQIVQKVGIMNLRAIITVSKKAQDWRWTMKVSQPLDHWLNFWNCKLISTSEDKTEYTFGPMPWTKKVKPGQKISLGFNGIFIDNGVRPHTVSKVFTATEQE